jgi:formyl-CoA transferase
VPQRIGNRYEASFPYDSFNAKDGSLVIGAANDKLFKLMCEVMSLTDLPNDPRFASNPLRVENNAALKPIMENWLKDHTRDEVVDLLLKKGVPAAPIYSIDQVVKDPHIAEAREMFVDMEHPVAGKLKITGNQIKLSGTPVKYRVPAPTLGQHTMEILKETLGLTEAEFSKYEQAKIF